MHALCVEIGKYAHWKDSNFSIFVFSICRHMHYYYYSYVRYTVVAEIKGVYDLNSASSLCEGAAAAAIFPYILCVCVLHACQSEKLYTLSFWPNVTVSSAHICVTVNHRCSGNHLAAVIYTYNWPGGIHFLFLLHTYSLRLRWFISFASSVKSIDSILSADKRMDIGRIRPIKILIRKWAETIQSIFLITHFPCATQSHARVQKGLSMSEWSNPSVCVLVRIANLFISIFSILSISTLFYYISYYIISSLVVLYYIRSTWTDDVGTYCWVNTLPFCCLPLSPHKNAFEIWNALVSSAFNNCDRCQCREKETQWQRDSDDDGKGINNK